MKLRTKNNSVTNPGMQLYVQKKIFSIFIILYINTFYFVKMRNCIFERSAIMLQLMNVNHETQRPAIRYPMKNISLLHPPKAFFRNLNMFMKFLMVHKQFVLKSLLLLRLILLILFSKFHKFLNLSRTIAAFYKV